MGTVAIRDGFWSGRHRLIGIGFGRPRKWFQWDRGRTNKRTAIATPDDPDAVETILRKSVETH